MNNEFKRRRDIKSISVFKSAVITIALFLIIANPTFAQEGDITQSGLEQVDVVNLPQNVTTYNDSLTTDESAFPSTDNLSAEQQNPNLEQIISEEITAVESEVEEVTLEPEILEEAALMATEGIEPANQTHGKYIAPEALATDGSLRYEYPIIVPPGRDGLSPDLKLTYNSSDFSQNSILADGWSFNIPYIQRIHKNGVDKLYSEDYFMSSLDGELVDQGAGVYVPRTEQGSFIQYIYVDDTWTLTDKSGTQYHFGSTTQSRQANPNESNEIFAWMLEEVIDTNGNTISYTYFKNEGQIYPDEISYNQDAEFVISFNRASSSHATIIYSSGFKIKTNYHINRIEIEEDSALVSKVEFEISDSQLNEINVTGYEEEVPSTLAPTEFLYTSESDGVGWDTSSDYATYLPNWSSDSWNSMRFVDVNADGLPDVMFGDGAMINDGSSFVTATSWNVAQNSTSDDWYFFNPSNDEVNVFFNVLDFNGDGLTDIANYDDDHVKIYLNSGTGWDTTADSSTYLYNWGYDNWNGTRFIDVNADALPDMMFGNGALINNGSSFEYDSNWDVAQNSISDDWGFVKSNGDPNPFFNAQDFNADGLIDVSYYDEDVDELKIYLNDGSGWDTNNDYTTYLPNWNIDSWNSMRFIDVNADGLPDLTGGNGAMINNGSTFEYDSSWDVTQNSISDDWYFFNSGNGQYNPLFNALDFNGDGLVDFSNYLNDEVKIYKNNSPQYKVISEIKNANHGSIDVTYTTAQVQDASNQVHIIVPIVSSLEFDDLVGSNHTVEYEYENADFYFKSHSDRRFSGFGQVTKINPDDTMVVSKYHQANGQSGNEPIDSYAKLGKVFEETVIDSSDDLYLRKRFNYEDASVGTNATSSLLQSVLTQLYDGTSSHVDTASEYVYDSYGNVVTEIQYGIVDGDPDGTFNDTGSDTRTTESVFMENTTDYIVGLLSTRTFKNDSGIKEAQVNYLYDADGNVLEEGRWIEGSDYATTSRTYSSYGLVVTQSDPLNNTTTYSYDANNLYPATVNNDLSQETTYTYDYSSGKPKVVTDPNGKIIEYSYDGLDRLVAENKTQGNSSSTEITREFSYNTSASPQYTVETIYRDSTNSQDIRTYHDGFGREIQKKSELSEDWATIDTQYDDMGRVMKTSLPYLTPSVGKSNITTDADLLVINAHDALGRVVSISDARGETEMEYAGFTTVVTDAENNNKEYVTDAYENLVEVKEFNASSTYTTEYTYNTQNLLTSIVDAENNERGISYDGLGRRTVLEDLHSSSDTTFGVWNFTYDDHNLLSITDPNGSETTYTYDSLNRALTEDNDNVSGTEVTYTYDSCTNGVGLLCGVGTREATTTFTYLKQGVEATKSVTIDFSTYTSETTYNRQNQPISITYPNSTEISYEYDIQGLPSQITKDSTVIVSSEYGVHGKPTLITYANGLVTENTYDENLLYSLVSKTTGFATSSATTTIITSTTTETVPGAVVQELNDNLNTNLDKWVKSGTDNWYIENEDEVNVPGSVSGNNVASSYNCDSACHITLADPLDLSTASSAQLTLWRYVDNDLDSGEYGQLQLFNGSSWVTVSSWADDNTWYYETYNLSGYLVNNFDIRITGKMSSAAEKVQVDDVIVTVTYHDEIVTTVSTTTATTTLEGYIEDLQNLSYEYDAVGNIVTITDSSDTDTAKIQSFAYDDLYRLVGATTTNVATGTSPYTQTYTYSPVGNITNFDGVNMSYNDGGYTNPHAVTSVGGQAYTYSNNGNLTNDGVWAHAWDYRNRLVSSSNGVGTTSYTYNHENDRIKLVEGGETTYYPLSDYEVINGVPKLYLSLGDLIVATVQGATTTFIHTDHLGGTTLTTNSTGTITQTLDYYPYGDTRINNGDNDEDTQYTGYKKDVSTGLNYAGARYYAGDRGRFISQDPVFTSLGNQALLENKMGIKFNTYLRNPQTHNSYAYAGNNPIKYTDKNGEFLFIPAAYLTGAWALAELGFTAYDVYDTVQTLNDKNSTNSDIGLSLGGLALGTIAPGGGYGKAGKVGLSAIDSARIAKANNWGYAGALEQHTIDHAADFGLKSSDYEGYAKTANSFVQTASAGFRQGNSRYDSFLGTGRDAGKTYLFDTKTSTFAVKNANGTVATAYKPYGGDKQKAASYWQRQKKNKGGI